MSSTNRGAVRRENDDYQTPPACIDALLQHVEPFGRFLEPCKGSGNILRAVQPHVAIADWAEITEGRDFFKVGLGAVCFDWIITNPPYSVARGFIGHALSLADHVAMLLRLNFLESEGRREWWQSRLPTALYVLARRPGFLDRDGKRVLGKNGTPGTDSCAYGWFVWSKLYRGIHVIGEPEFTLGGRP